MKSISIFLTLIIITLCACSNSKELTQDQERENLSTLLERINTLAENENCTNATEWTYVEYGSKACGGPQGFIAYSNNINTSQFLALVKEYTQEEDNYNKKWGVISDCSIPQEPSSVSCENGAAVLVY